MKKVLVVSGAVLGTMFLAAAVALRPAIIFMAIAEEQSADEAE